MKMDGGVEAYKAGVNDHHKVVVVVGVGVGVGVKRQQNMGGDMREG